MFGLKGYCPICGSASWNKSKLCDWHEQEQKNNVKKQLRRQAANRSKTRRLREKSDWYGKA